MLNCIIVDDEPFALVLLEDYINKIPFLNLVAKCNDAFGATKVFEDTKIDLVFIDIQMPGITGLQFIESLLEKPMFILVTAYKQYALDSYALDVIDYLVKPFSLDRFLKACNKARALHEMKLANKQLANNTEKKEFFFINADYSLLKVQYRDILWVEGLRDYIKIQLRNPHKPIVARNNVAGMEKLLPSAKFIRIHKSSILSINDITAIKRNSVFIGEHEFTIGDKYRNAVIQFTNGNTNPLL